MSLLAVLALVGGQAGCGAGVVGPVVGPAVPVVVLPARETLEEYYRQGTPWAEFYAATKSRRQLWEENWARAAVPEDLLARARASGGTWRFLIIAVDSCSDSVSSIPVIAKLAESVEGLDLRIVHPDIGRPLMEARRTPDGRAATPTLILLDEKYEEAGCWIERPAALQRWYEEHTAGLSQDQIFERKMAWYRDDAGVETLRDIVAMLEAAVSGQRGCAAAR